MSLWFKTLFTLSVTHEYYGGACPDFRLLLPESTRLLARNGRLLIKQIGHTVYCVFEADESGNAIKPLAGETVRLGLDLRNPHFGNFTELALGGLAALYRNRTALGQLDAPVGVRLVGSVIAHDITKDTRPVTLNLKEAGGKSLQSEQINSASVTRFSFATGLLADNSALLPGPYTVRETYPATTGETQYYLDPKLLAAGAFGVVEIALDAGFYAAPPAFEIAFTARKQKLKYYVVAHKYGANDFAKLNVSDQGFGDDQRSVVAFTRVARDNFGADDLSPALVGSGEDKVALFKSDTEHARQARARSKIQLKSNNEILIPHLPAPTEHQTQADLIIHVAKAKP